MVYASTFVREPLDAKLTLAEQQKVTARHYEMILVAKDSVDYARTNYRVDNYGLWAPLNQLNILYSEELPELKKEKKLMLGYDASENVIAISRRILTKFAGEVEPIAKAALKPL